MCAERVAIWKALSEGERDFTTRRGGGYRTTDAAVRHLPADHLGVLPRTRRSCSRICGAKAGSVTSTNCCRAPLTPISEGSRMSKHVRSNSSVTSLHSCQRKYYSSSHATRSMLCQLRAFADASHADSRGTSVSTLTLISSAAARSSRWTGRAALLKMAASRSKAGASWPSARADIDRELHGAQKSSMRRTRSSFPASSTATLTFR